MEIQHLLGSDITMVLDECTPYPATEAQAAESDAAFDALGGKARAFERKVRFSQSSANRLPP